MEKKNMFLLGKEAQRQKQVKLSSLTESQPWALEIKSASFANSSWPLMYVPLVILLIFVMSPEVLEHGHKLKLNPV